MQRFPVRCPVRGPLLLAALQLSSACGGEDDRVTFPPPVEASAPEPDDGAEPTGAEPSAVAPDIATEGTLQTDRLAQAVVAILSTQCVSCHGPRTAQGGLGDLRDLESLIAQGTIVPGAGASSPLVLRMSDGSMPPEVAGVSPGVQVPTSGEIALVRRFIDQLPVAPAPDCSPPPFQGLDDVYAALLADVLQAPEQDRPFLRYVGLTPASNAGLCGVALERQRSALLGLVNGVSTALDIRAPRAVDSDGVLYRIDLRDYRWNRAIDLKGDGSSDFADGWLALVAAAAPYGLELAGPEADALKQATSTAVPFLPAPAFVHAASAGDLYYALIDAKGTLDEHQLALGMDVVADLFDGNVKQAGAVARRGASIEFRVTRFEQGVQPGRYYWLLDEDDSVGNYSIFQDPIDIQSGQWQAALFNLPNGIQAFEVAGEFGERSALPRRDCSREDCSQPALPNAAACPACHAAGLLPVTDLIRPFVEQNPTLFDRDTFAATQHNYPTEDEFNQLLLNDSQPHLDAAARAGATLSGPEPISFVYLQFELDPLPLRRVAAELGVPPPVLTAALDRLDPQLSVLQAAEGTIDRSTLNATYVTSMCTLHAGSKNRPIACLEP